MNDLVRLAHTFVGNAAFVVLFALGLVLAAAGIGLVVGKARSDRLADRVFGRAPKAEDDEPFLYSDPATRRPLW